MPRKEDFAPRKIIEEDEVTVIQDTYIAVTVIQDVDSDGHETVLVEG